MLWTRAEKRQLVVDEVNAIIADADSQAANGDWAAAEERALRADAILSANDVGKQPRAKVTQKIEEFRSGEQERKTMKRLVDLRLHSNSPPHEMDRRYAEAFRDIRLDLDQPDPKDIGPAIPSPKSKAFRHQ